MVSAEPGDGVQTADIGSLRAARRGEGEEVGGLYQELGSGGNGDLRWVARRPFFDSSFRARRMRRARNDESTRRPLALSLTVQRYFDLTVDRDLRFGLRRRGFLRLRTRGWRFFREVAAARFRAWW